MLIFSIKNEKLGFFNRPIYVESSNEALSYIQNILMSDADRVMLGLKNDLALYAQGEIDFTTGIITGFKHPKKVCDLVEIFDSIPEDKIPQTSKVLTERIARLEAMLEEFCKTEEVE